MRVLLDENIPHDLRAHLRHHETFTAAYLGWGGLKNGQLLDAAEKDAFDVMVTGDLSLNYQQNMATRRIAIVSLSAIGWPVIEPHVSKIIEAVDAARLVPSLGSMSGNSGAPATARLARRSARITFEAPAS